MIDGTLKFLDSPGTILIGLWEKIQENWGGKKPDAASAAKPAEGGATP